MNGTKEPVAIGAGLIALVNAVLGCLVLFGVNWTPEQTAGIMSAVTAAVAFFTALIVRSKVTPIR